MSAGAPLRYCGRDFSAAEIDWLRALIARRPALRRAALSRALCERLGWRKPDGGLKDMSARVAMLRMHRDGLIALPPPRNRPRAMRPPAPSPETEPPLFPPPARLAEARPARVEPVAGAIESRRWNAFVERHHYLGYAPLPGAQLRYFARAADGQPLALFGFGAAAWKTAPRDRFVGWTDEHRRCNLPLVVNNARFLILPWIRIPNLASHLLAQVQRRSPTTGSDATPYAPSLWDLLRNPALSTAPPTAGELDPRRQNPGPRQARPPPRVRPPGQAHLPKPLRHDWKTVLNQ